MKKSIGIILAGSLSLMLLLGGCDIKFGVGKVGSTNTSGNSTPIDESYEISNAKSLIIDSEISNSKISTYNGDKIRITGIIGTKSEGVNYSLDGDKVTLKEEYSNLGFGVNNNEGISEYQILIPKNYSGDVSIEYGAGTVEVQDIEVNDLNIKGGAGELKVNNVVFNDLKLSSGVGSVKISLSKKCGNINIDGGMGETVLKMKEVGGNLKVNGGVGSIDVWVPENAPIYFNTSSGIGSNDINNVKTSGEKTYLFNLSVGLGEVKVHN